MLNLFDELNKFNLFLDSQLRGPSLSQFFSKYSVNQADFSFNVVTNDKKCTIEVTKGGKTSKVELDVPLTSQSKLLLTTTDNAGNPVTKEFSSSEFLSKTNFPEEVSPLLERVKSFLQTNFAFLPKKESSSVTDQPATSEASCADKSTDPSVPSVETKEAEKQWRTFRVHRKDDKILQFQGEVLLKLTTPLKGVRYFEYFVFQTKGGSYVAVKVGRSLLPSESDQVTSFVSKNKSEILSFFGLGSSVSREVASRLNWSDEDFIENID